MKCPNCQRTMTLEGSRGAVFMYACSCGGQMLVDAMDDELSDARECEIADMIGDMTDELSEYV